MKTKALLILIVLAIGFSQSAEGQVAGNAVTDLLLNAWSPKNFTSAPVTDQQLNIIIACGIKAPSGRNNQPWHFTVVKDEALMKELIGNITPGNVIIVISGKVSSSGTTPDFDCALATENMFIAATSLGLGARIYGGPVSKAISKSEELKIPEGYKTVMLLRIGSIEKSVDAISGATSRKEKEELVDWIR